MFHKVCDSNEPTQNNENWRNRQSVRISNNQKTAFRCPYWGIYMSFEHCQSINSLMTGFDRTWFFVGGWAIDLFVGKETRVHQDLEFAVFRKDQIYLKDYLEGWEFKKVIKGEFHSWENEFLELPIHEIHASKVLNGDNIEILLNETKENDWTFRRDLRISYPISSVWSNY